MRDLRLKLLKGCIPVGEHSRDGLGEFLRIATGTALRLGGMSDTGVRQGCNARFSLGLEFAPSIVRELAEGDHRIELSWSGKCGQPAISVGDNGGIVLMLIAALLAVDGIEKGIDHHVAAVNPELGEEALGSVACRADENPPGDVFRRCRILAYDEHARAAIEPPSVEDWPPLDAERLRWVSLSTGVVAGQGEKRLGDWALIEVVCHGPTLCAIHPSIKDAGVTQLACLG